MRLGTSVLGVALAAGALVLWNRDSANRATASAVLLQRSAEIPVSTYNHVLIPRLPEAATATVLLPSPARAVSMARGVADANAGASDDGEGSSSSGGMSVFDIVKLTSQPLPDAQLADPTSSQHWPSPPPPPRTPWPPLVSAAARPLPPPRPMAPPDLLRGVPEAIAGAESLVQDRLTNHKGSAAAEYEAATATAADTVEAAAAAEAGSGRGLRRKMGRGKGLRGNSGIGAEATRGEAAETAAGLPSHWRPPADVAPAYTGGACPAQPPPSGKLRVVSDVTKVRAWDLYDGLAGLSALLTVGAYQLASAASLPLPLPPFRSLSLWLPFFSPTSATPAVSLLPLSYLRSPPTCPSCPTRPSRSASPSRRSQSWPTAARLCKPSGARSSGGAFARSPSAATKTETGNKNGYRKKSNERARL
jgi:hypothetical protein